MKYSHFEILALVLGSVAIVGSALIPSTAQLIPAEVVAQLLLILVLAGALHWGRNGGFVTALIAIAIYVGMRYPALNAEGLSADVVTMIVSRALGYTAIGLIGGELAGRLKYLLTRVERDVLIDPVTRVYSGPYAGRTIATALGRQQRYGTPCSVLTLTIAPAQWSSLRSSLMKSLMRRVASNLRNDVRLVDDVAYHDNGGFIVILPDTDHVGAMVVAERLRAGVASLIDCDTADVSMRVLTCGNDDEALKTLADALTPAPRSPDEPAPAHRVDGRRATDRPSENV